MCLIFIHIVERSVSDIFSTCVFNNIMEVTFIFSPRDFAGPRASNTDNYFYFNNLANLRIQDGNR